MLYLTAVMCNLYILSENNYQEEKCLNVIEDLRQCCIKWGEKAFETCQGINMDKPYYVKPAIIKDKNAN